MISIPSSPGDLGPLPQFSTWRRYQDQSISDVISSDKVYVAQAMPTGGGKSLSYVTVSKIGKWSRTIILTSTKALMSQLLRDFRPLGMVEIKGKNSYLCSLYPSTRVTAEDAPCSFLTGFECGQETKCPYRRDLERAQESKLVVTNYPYWVLNNRWREGGSDDLGDVDLLVLDEAHDAPDQVAQALTIEITHKEISKYLNYSLPQHELASLQDWHKWAHVVRDAAKIVYEEAVRHAKDNMKEAKTAAHMKKLISKLDLIQQIRNMSNWVFDLSRGVLRLGPVWPRMARRYLFRSAKKANLVSATLTRKTLEYLGLGQNEYEFFEYPSTFPVQSRPFIYIPTVRVDHRMSMEDKLSWVRRVDQIIRSRKQSKGIVHTTSYERRNLLLSHSQFRDIMYVHDTDTLRDTVKEFHKVLPPAVLVSPAVTTGYDFPYENCRFQIIGKVPWPDTRNKLTKARSEQDSDYPAYLAMQTLIQTVGRGMRAEDDFCESFIIDDHWQWFSYKYGHFAPGWFKESCRTSRVIPQ